MKLLTQIGYVRVNTEVCNDKGPSNWRLWLPKWNSSNSPVLVGFALTRNREINYVTIWECQNNDLLHDVHYQYTSMKFWVIMQVTLMMIVCKWKWFYHITFPFISLLRFKLNSFPNLFISGFVQLYCDRICFCLFSALCHCFFLYTTFLGQLQSLIFEEWQSKPRPAFD